MKRKRLGSVEREREEEGAREGERVGGVQSELRWEERETDM